VSFATAQSSPWPQFSGGGNHVSDFPNGWQLPENRLDLVSNPSPNAAVQARYQNPNLSIDPYVANFSAPTSHPSSTPWKLYPPQTTITIGPGMAPQDYPSPHSEASARSSSMDPTALPANLGSRMPSGPALPPEASPTPAARRDPSGEPTRNADGQLSCILGSCKNKPRTFKRKCEWQ
jgi:hypothetical protein